MQPKLVLDTNILLVSISKKSKFRWIFDSFLNEDFVLCITTDILNEYHEIISKQMTSQIADVTLQIIENAPNVEHITRFYKWNLIQNDPDDNKFVDCALMANAAFIVTNDRHFNILKTIEFPKINCIDISEFETLFRN